MKGLMPPIRWGVNEQAFQSILGILGGPKSRFFSRIVEGGLPLPLGSRTPANGADGPLRLGMRTLRFPNWRRELFTEMGDWSLAAIGIETGSATVYRVDRCRGAVPVDAWSPDRSCSALSGLPAKQGKQRCLFLR